MQTVLDDLASIDTDPAQAADVEPAESAIDACVALAERAPETYSPDVVEHLSGLIVEVSLVRLLAPLRLVARSLPKHRERAVQVALDTLRKGAVVEASRFLLEFPDLVSRQALDEAVVHSLVLLAGGPETDEFGHRAIRSARNDPSALRLVADREPSMVVDSIRRLLQRRRPTSGLVLPPGLRPDSSDESPSDAGRCAAAGAIRWLATSHPDLAASLAEDLVLNLADGDEDAYGLYPVADLQQTLAVMLTTSRARNVMALIEHTGMHASAQHRERLFGVLERVRRLLDPKYPWREPGDPILDGEQRRALTELVIQASLLRVDGGWGDDVALQAATVIDEVTSDASHSMVQHVQALLGALLVTLAKVDDGPAPRIALGDGPAPGLLMIEAMSRRMTRSSTAHRLASAIKNVAAHDPLTTLAAVNEVLQSERANERETELAWRLLPVLGEIGAAHGAQAGVLRSVLPSLYTYVLHPDASLRAAAIEAWTRIASRHPTPSSLSDLLPVLAQDPYVAVIQAVLQAAPILECREEERRILLIHAWSVASGLPASHKDTLKRALQTVRHLGKADPAAVERLTLKRADELDGHDLRETLAGDWLPESRRSSAMARLRLRLARDHRVNDRVNSREDEQLTKLLECGIGLLALPKEDLTAAAMEWAPEYPHWAAEFAEVLWRAGRVAQAGEVMAAILAAIPQERPYARGRAIVGCVLAAIHLDSAMSAGAAIGALQEAARAATSALRLCEKGDHPPSDLFRGVADRILARALMLGAVRPESLVTELPCVGPDVALPGADPAQSRRERAARLAKVGRRLRTSAQRRTDTAAYVRCIASLCEVGAHLLRFDAAEMEASESREAHLIAAKRRAATTIEETEAFFGVDDPIARPLVQSLRQAVTIAAGGQVALLLAQWARLPIPLPLVSGPRARPRRTQRLPDSQEKSSKTPQPVVVALAYLDNRLVTGPQVLRPNTVYVLRLDVRTGPWPAWADRLDAELLSHFDEALAHTPTFSWPRSESSNGSVAGEGSVILRFRVTAGQPAPPFRLSFRFRGRVGEEGEQSVCGVAGHRELRLRPFDASRDALTTYRIVDERLLAIYERFHGAGYDEGQVQAFCRLLTAICKAGLPMTWEKPYKRGRCPSERDFHDDLHQRLLEDPELGGRVERNAPLGLGYLDVRHDGITAELKVERQAAVTQESALQYVGQTAQYAAADGARLSILCILDMSPKERPVGTPENYIWQVQPAEHGLTNTAPPSLVTVVVINANLPVPSHWSRSPAKGHTSK